VLIAKNIIENAKINFIAFAPAGKEVEELSGKEIIAALRKKITAGEFMQSAGGKARRLQREGAISKTTAKKRADEQEPRLPSEEEKEIFRSKLYDLIGTRGAYILNSKLEILRKVPIGELAFALSRLGNEAYAVILDGTASPEVIRAAERTACRHIVARNFTAFTTKINLISV
jgi:DNA primase